jgi:hypothetical protein
MAIRLIIGIVVGASAGFAYFRFIGCAGGACPLTKNPFFSTFYGALIGALASGAFHH